jgi:hypothetical protein
MKPFSFHAAPDSTVTALHSRFPKMVRRLPITAMAALLALEPLAASAATAGSPIPVPVTGTVGSGANIIDLSGQVVITPRIITDGVFSNKITLELAIDFRGVKGVPRAGGQQNFVTEAQTVIHRPLLSRDAIEVTFPYHLTGNFSSARPAKAALAVSYDANSGIRITSAIKDVPTN